LAYHPLFALGPIALVALILRRDLQLSERLLAGCALFALLAQLYVQASWWVWWNGTGTFGNRSLAVGGVVVVVALARWLLLLMQSGTRKSLVAAVTLLSLTAACCCWSFLLYLQEHSNYVTWRELWHEQRRMLLDSSVFVSVAVAALLSLGFGITFFSRLRIRAVFAAFALFVATLAARGLLGTVVLRWLTSWGVERFSSAAQGLVSALALTVILYLVTDRHAALWRARCFASSSWVAGLSTSSRLQPRA